MHREPVPGWSARPRPRGDRLAGRFAHLEALDARRHTDALYASFAGHDTRWDFMPYGPFGSKGDFRAWVEKMIHDPETVFFAIKHLDTGEFSGVAAYLRIAPAAGSIEVGHINYSPALARSAAATEAMFLMMEQAFTLGYRRYEWKCDACNIASRRAAQRLGFSYEGIFRQATVVKGRNRDTAWFACIDKEWPALREGFRAWLSPSNFDTEGHQITPLSEITEKIRAAGDPRLQ